MWWVILPPKAAIRARQGNVWSCTSMEMHLFPHKIFFYTKLWNHPFDGNNHATFDSNAKTEKNKAYFKCSRACLQTHRSGIKPDIQIVNDSPHSLITAFSLAPQDIFKRFCWSLKLFPLLIFALQNLQLFQERLQYGHSSIHKAASKDIYYGKNSVSNIEFTENTIKLGCVYFV